MQVPAMLTEQQKAHTAPLETPWIILYSAILFTP